VYLLTYLSSLRPEIIINVTDHNVFFLNLKKYFPKIILVVIQQAFFALDTFNKILERKEKLTESKFIVDYACLYGKYTKLFYSHFMKSKYLVTGSVKNNMFSVNRSDDQSVVFISQFRMNINYDFKENKFKNILFEKSLYNNLKEYCQKYNKKLLVLSCHLDCQLIEKEYFNKYLGKNNFTFIPKKSWAESYINSNNFNYFVTQNSTLGYELTAKGKKVAFIYNYKNKNNKFKNLNQSFFDVKTSGHFWTSSVVYKKFEKTLNSAFFSNIKEYDSQRKKYIAPYIVYNKDNKIFRNLINKLSDNKVFI
jgi:surface carbohydrate biosynthesis protein